MRQPGVATRQQSDLALAAFDVLASTPDELRELFRAWSAAAARLMAGRRAARDVHARLDSGEVQELDPAGLTITFGLGDGLFGERFGLARQRPAALQPLPTFEGDALDPARSGGDLCVQACADDPQVAFHAVRTLARVGAGAVRLRWAQTGFVRRGSIEDRGITPRNLLGFREGANNLRGERLLDRHVWIPGGDRRWMTDGTYLVARRIRLRLEAWDAQPVAAQEAVIGRTKVAGDKVGELAAGSHLQAARGAGDGTPAMLRRSYNYFDGVDGGTGELDAGLVLLCFVRDPRRQWVPVQERLARDDALNAYGVHTGSGVWAVPPGWRAGGRLAEGLL